MAPFLTDWLMETWTLLLEASPWVLGGFLLAGIVHVMVPTQTVAKHLGQPGLRGVVKASLLGIPLPLCSCSVIPLASSIRKQGAGPGPYTSFLISTPETGVDSIAISYALLGPLLTIVRPVAAFVTAVVGGALADRLVPHDARRVGDDGTPTLMNSNPPPSDAETCDNTCGCSTPPPASFTARVIEAARYGLVEMIADLAPWLAVGFVFAGLAGAAIPDGFLQQYVGGGITAMLVMLLVGLPMYVCSTSSTPIAAALIARGLSPGAALVFLLAGPATNLTTMLVVGRDLGRVGLTIYLLTIASMAVAFGLLVDALAPTLPAALTVVPHCTGEYNVSVLWPFAAIFLLLILNGLRIRLRGVRI